MITANKNNCLIIKRATQKDYASIYKIAKSSKKGFIMSKKTWFYDKKELAGYIADKKRSILLVAFVNKRIAGFIHGRMINNAWYTVDTAATLPKYRSLGIGTLLFQKLELTAKRRGCVYFNGLVKFENKKAISFWQKQGFEKGKKFVWVEKFL